MARKRLRKAEERPPAPALTTMDRPREPEHTATFWRNTYEAERRLRERVSLQLRQEREESKRLREEIERHTKRKKVRRRLP